MLSFSLAILFTKLLISYHILPVHVLGYEASCWLLHRRVSLYRSYHLRPANDKISFPPTIDQKCHSHDCLTAASTPFAASTKLFLLDAHHKALEVAIATTLHRSGYLGYLDSRGLIL